MQRGLTYLLIIFGLLPFQISPKFFSFYTAPWLKGWAGPTSSTVESELLLVIEYTTYMIVTCTQSPLMSLLESWNWCFFLSPWMLKIFDEDIWFRLPNCRVASFILSFLPSCTLSAGWLGAVCPWSYGPSLPTGWPFQDNESYEWSTFHPSPGSWQMTHLGPDTDAQIWAEKKREPKKLGNLLLLQLLCGGDDALLEEEAVVLVELQVGLGLLPWALLQEPKPGPQTWYPNIIQ